MHILYVANSLSNWLEHVAGLVLGIRKVNRPKLG